MIDRLATRCVGVGGFTELAVVWVSRSTYKAFGHLFLLLLSHQEGWPRGCLLKAAPLRIDWLCHEYDEECVTRLLVAGETERMEGRVMA